MYTIYAVRDCEYCELAVEELTKRGESFFYYPMDNEIPRKLPSLQELKNRYTWPTVPIIIKNVDNKEQFIGGYTELMIYLEEEDES